MKQLTGEVKEVELQDSAAVGDLRSATADAFRTPVKQIVLRIAGDTGPLGKLLEDDTTKLSAVQISDGCTVDVHILSFTDAAGLG
eukprot:CAMPEP_0178395330 /NCGR_PEP_ID=MMETSP0689_2-20121128/13162_1 /TAXON_ID=160604 /ORGANISM="Amphidinium massartii, Strain CS-259" /LENGTH=84 /DNA_ID=CAMNT_0020015979 /DNA_START=15 /DNA_END=269 /DNA_ORIENTATION=+